MKRQMIMQSRPLTMAEVCEAIAAGKIPAQVEGDYYTVTHRSLRELRKQSETRVTLNTARPAGIAS